MGVFKNEVGRPSNKILKTRKIIYGSIIGLCLLLLLSLVFVITKVNKNKLKGAVSNNIELYAMKPQGGVETGTNTFSFNDSAQREFGAVIVNKNSDNVYYRYYTYANGSLKSSGSCIQLAGNSSVVYSPDTLSNSYSNYRTGKIVVYNYSGCTGELKNIQINYSYNQSVNYLYPNGQFLARIPNEDSNYVGSTWTVDDENRVKTIIGGEYGSSWFGAVFVAQEIRDNLMSRNTHTVSNIIGSDKFSYYSNNSSYINRPYVNAAYNYVFKTGNSAIKKRITNNSTTYNTTFINTYKFNYIINIVTSSAGQYFYNNPSLKAISWPGQSTTINSTTSNRTNNSSSNLSVQLTADTSNSNYVGYQNGVHYYSKTGDYNFYLKILGVNKQYYYRAFTYNTHAINSLTKVWASSCKQVTSDIDNLLVENLTIKDNISKKNRTARVKLYSDYSSCSKDIFGTSGNYLKVGNNKYYSDIKYSYNPSKTTKPASTNNNNTTSQSSGGNIKINAMVDEASNYTSGSVINTNTTGNKYITFNFSNYSDNNYYKWYTYSDISDINSFNASTTRAGWEDLLCKKLSSTSVISRIVSLGVQNSDKYKNRAGKIKVYASLSDCQNDSGGTSSKGIKEMIIKYQYGSNVKINVNAEGASNYTSGNVINTNTTGSKNVSFSFSDYSNNNYYKWYTYSDISDINTFNASTTKAGWEDSSCNKLSTYSRTSTLGIQNNDKYKNRAAKIKVYASLSDCRNDNGGTSSNGIAQFIIKYRYSDTDLYTNNNWVYVRSGLTSSSDSLVRDISYNVGTQVQSKCLSAALAYGVYILNPNGISSVSGAKNAYSPSSATYGGVCAYHDTIKSFYSTIVSNVDKGIPSVIHINYSGGEHWLTVVGYKNSVPSSAYNASDILNYLWVIDPYSNSGYNLSGRYDLLRVSDGQHIVAGKNGSNSIRLDDNSYQVLYWNSASSAKY